MIHVLLIVVHAVAAVAAFGLGCALLVRLPSQRRGGRLTAYLVAIWTAVLALTTVVLLDWSGLDALKRATFAVLVALAVWLLVRSGLAARLSARRRAGWEQPFLRHIGFVLISLFDGFCIVTAIDLRLPPAVVVAAAVGGVVAGVLATWRARQRATNAGSAVERAPA